MTTQEAGSSRIVMVTGDAEGMRDRLASTLQTCLAGLDVAPAIAGGGLRALLRLLRTRPDLVIAGQPGNGALGVMLYRYCIPRSRLVIHMHGMAARLSPIEGLLLRSADALLAEGAVAARALERRGLRVIAMPEYDDVAAFASCPAHRGGESAHRILHVGGLTPESGAADLLIDLAAWAELHPARAVEIWWAGDGDLRGVLAAQPLPQNMRQRFLGTLLAGQLPDVFAQCGLLALPTLARVPPGDCVTEALAAGLPVLGSAQCRSVGALVRDGETGWVFDPLASGGLQESLARALDADEGELDRMRLLARSGLAEVPGPGLGERVALLLRIAMAGIAAPAPTG